jgi:hypothetical protein
MTITRKPAGPYLIHTRPKSPTAGPQAFEWPDQTVAIERLVWQLCHLWLAPLRRLSGVVSAQRRSAP